MAADMRSFTKLECITLFSSLTEGKGDEATSSEMSNEREETDRQTDR
jgi:hypothetical protein